MKRQKLELSLTHGGPINLNSEFEESSSASRIPIVSEFGINQHPQTGNAAVSSCN